VTWLLLVVLLAGTFAVGVSTGLVLSWLIFVRDGAAPHDPL
jgi:hypothetical protein